MSSKKVYVPLSGPTAVTNLSSSQQSAIITYVNAVVHTGEENISFDLDDGEVNIVITPTPSIPADYIADVYISNIIGWDKGFF